MASYWIVVPRGNAELFELLSMAFRGRTGFSVIVDRRSEVTPPGVDRRARSEALGPDEIVIAEQAERSAIASDDRTAYVRTPVRRPVLRPQPQPNESGRRRDLAAPSSALAGQRLFTL